MDHILPLPDEPLYIKESAVEQREKHPYIDMDWLYIYEYTKEFIYAHYKPVLKEHGLNVQKDVQSILSKKTVKESLLMWSRNGMSWEDTWNVIDKQFSLKSKIEMSV